MILQMIKYIRKIWLNDNYKKKLAFRKRGQIDTFIYW